MKRTKKVILYAKMMEAERHVDRLSATVSELRKLLAQEESELRNMEQVAEDAYNAWFNA